MSRVAACLFFILLLVSCAGNNISLPLLSPAPDKPANCAPLFPQGNYQFVHLIEFSMTGGNHGTAMGVTVINDNTIESALMTVEGFVLFAAGFSDTLAVSRAVPPFDKPGFAAGMMRDIQAIFLQPEGELVAGILSDTTSVCRIIQDSGQITDIISSPDHCRQLNIYSPDQQLSRQIFGQECTVNLDGTAIPENLQLRSWEMGGYSLKMTLISAETNTSTNENNLSINGVDRAILP